MLILLPYKEKELLSIQWQHIGNGFQKIKSTYKSKRTHRSTQEPLPGSEKGVIIDLYKGNVESFDDFKISYAAYNKAEKIGFETEIEVCFVRNDGEFYDCYDTRRLISENWRNYKHEFSALTGAEGIALKIRPKGLGTFRIHNVFLSKKVDDQWGKPIATVRWDNSKSISEYVKQLDESKESYQVELDKVRSLMIYAKMLAIKPNYQTTDNVALFKTSLAYGDIWEAEIGNGLVCKMPLVLKGDNSTTYPKADSLMVSILANKLKKGRYGKKADGNGLILRIANVINAGNIIHHFFPYFDVLNVNWEEAVSTGIKRSFSDKDKHDHKLTLESILAHLVDAHVSVSGKFFGE